MDTFTSLLAGFTIFAVLGNLSHTTGIPIDEVATGKFSWYNLNTFLIFT